MDNFAAHECVWGDAESSCGEPATKMVILHVRLADGRVLDITAWVCDRHYRAFAESGADDISF